MATTIRLAPLVAILSLASCGGGGDSSSGGGVEGAIADCYYIPAGDVYFAWAGGTGPRVIETYEDSTCSAPGTGIRELVAVAANETQAIERCEAPSPDTFETVPALDDPNSFYECD